MLNLLCVWFPVSSPTFANVFPACNMEVLIIGTNDIVLAGKDTFDYVINIISELFAEYVEMCILHLLVVDE